MKPETAAMLAMAAQEQDMSIDELVETLLAKPDAMNIEQYLLISIAEECAEIAQRCAKALRFGIDEVQEGQPFNNAQRIAGEFNDLVGLINLWNTYQDTDGNPDNKIKNSKKLIAAKEEKVMRWMEYAVEQGTLLP